MCKLYQDLLETSTLRHYAFPIRQLLFTVHLERALAQVNEYHIIFITSQGVIVIINKYTL